MKSFPRIFLILQENDMIRIFMTYAKGGVLQTRNANIPLQTKLNIFQSICKAVKNMHDRHYVHFDIKGRIIFLYIMIVNISVYYILISEN